MYNLIPSNFSSCKSADAIYGLGMKYLVNPRGSSPQANCMKEKQNMQKAWSCT